MERINSLVLSGGGARGAFELGVCDWLIGEEGVHFDVISGVSAGALNAAMLAQGRGLEGQREALERLERVYFSIKNHKDIFLKRGPAGVLGSPTMLVDLIGAIGSTALYDHRPLAEKIAEHISLERLRHSGVELRIGVVSLNRGEYVSVDQKDPHLDRYVLASASIPLIFPAVEIGGELYVDGGTRNVAPLSDAFSATASIADERRPCDLYLVLSTPLKLDRFPSERGSDVVAVLNRVADIMMAGVVETDLKEARRINSCVALARKKGWDRAELEEREMGWLADKRQAEIILFEPPEVTIDILEFNPGRIRAAFEAGRRMGRTVMEGRRASEGGPDGIQI